MRRDLVERALDLARMLAALLPDDPGVSGLLALILLTDARRETRLGADGRPAVARRPGPKTVGPGGDPGRRRAGAAGPRHRPPGRFALMAAIAAVHSGAPTWDDTDWHEVVGLYDVLVQIWPSPVVALNRAVAVGFEQGPEAGLAALEPLTAEPQLAGYGYLAAARADFLRRLGRNVEARHAYEEALLLTENRAEQVFLAGRLSEITERNRA